MQKDLQCNYNPEDIYSKATSISLNIIFFLIMLRRISILKELFYLEQTFCFLCDLTSSPMQNLGEAGEGSPIGRVPSDKVKGMARPSKLWSFLTICMHFMHVKMGGSSIHLACTHWFDTVDTAPPPLYLKAEVKAETVQLHWQFLGLSCKSGRKRED